MFWLEFFRQGLAALSLFSSSLFRDKALHVNGLCSILIGDSEQCGYRFCGSGVQTLRRTGISFRRRPQGLRLVSEFTWKPCASKTLTYIAIQREEHPVKLCTRTSFPSSYTCPLWTKTHSLPCTLCSILLAYCMRKHEFANAMARKCVLEHLYIHTLTYTNIRCKQDSTT